MKAVRKLLVLFTVLALGLTLQSGTASAAVVYTNQIDLTGFYTYNPCNGELVTIDSGVLTEKLTFTINGNNVNGDSIVSTQNVRGTGDLGNTYTSSYQSKSRFKGSFVNGSFNWLANARFKLISATSEQNFFEVYKQRYSINPNGDVTHDTFSLTSSCR
jgi:hypothetical protein